MFAWVALPQSQSAILPFLQRMFPGLRSLNEMKKGKGKPVDNVLGVDERENVEDRVKNGFDFALFVTV